MATKNNAHDSSIFLARVCAIRAIVITHRVPHLLNKSQVYGDIDVFKEQES